MNYPQQLNEFLQDSIGQSIHFLYEVQLIDGKFHVTLTLGDSAFSVQSVDRVSDGKQYLALDVLNQLRRLKTEAQIRRRLGLSEVKRSTLISAIREELQRIHQLRRCGKKAAYRRLVPSCQILDSVERELTDTPSPVTGNL